MNYLTIFAEMKEITPGGYFLLSIWLVIGIVFRFWPVWAFFILVSAIRGRNKTVVKERVVYVKEEPSVYPKDVQWTEETTPPKRKGINWF